VVRAGEVRRRRRRGRNAAVAALREVGIRDEICAALRGRSG
jgi:hypothetical protein